MNNNGKLQTIMTEVMCEKYARLRDYKSYYLIGVTALVTEYGILDNLYDLFEVHGSDEMRKHYITIKRQIVSWLIKEYHMTTLEVAALLNIPEVHVKTLAK